MSLTTEAAPRAGTVRVLVIDEDRTFAELVAGALAADGMTCVGSAHSGSGGVEMCRRLRPDAVVIDIRMIEQDGLAAVRSIRAALPRCAIAVLTGYQDFSWVMRSMEAGASAFISKHGPLSEMRDALSRARAGTMIVAPSVYAERPDRSCADPLPRLTRREHDVLVRLCGGMPVRDIATALGLSTENCRGAVRALNLKMGTRSQLATVVRAQELGLVGHPVARAAGWPGGAVRRG